MYGGTKKVIVNRKLEINELRKVSTKVFVYSFVQFQK